MPLGITGLERSVLENDSPPSLLVNNLVNHTGWSQADGPNSRIQPLNIFFGLLIPTNSTRQSTKKIIF